MLQNNAVNYTPGYSTLDLNALITNIIAGSMGFSFGEDPNLDGAMEPTPASNSNPKAPAGVNVRNCIQPTVGWADNKPLDPALPPAWAVSSYDAILRGASPAPRTRGSGSGPTLASQRGPSSWATLPVSPEETTWRRSLLQTCTRTQLRGSLRTQAGHGRTSRSSPDSLRSSEQRTRTRSTCSALAQGLQRIA